MNSILSNLLRQKGLTEEKHRVDGEMERFFSGIALREYQLKQDEALYVC